MIKKRILATARLRLRPYALLKVMATRRNHSGHTEMPASGYCEIPTPGGTLDTMMNKRLRACVVLCGLVLSLQPLQAFAQSGQHDFDVDRYLENSPETPRTSPDRLDRLG
jgi:hypothetical protein